jgi:hypothetical protein
MRRFGRRGGIAAIAIGLAVASGAGIALASQTGGAAGAIHTSFGSQPHGVNFLVKSDLDVNFCMQDNVGVTSTLELNVCGSYDAQRIVFAQDVDGSVVMVTFNGQCLDASGPIGTQVHIGPCSFHGTEKFVYSPTQQIENEKGTKCLMVNKAAGGEQVTVEKCATGQTGQTWILGF